MQVREVITTKRIIVRKIPRASAAAGPAAARPAHALPDTDNDGILDNWEKLHFSGLSVAGANSDFDGDGFPDFSEQHAGTDPKDSSSSLRFDTPIDVKNQTVLLRWQSVPGRRYRVEKSNNGDPTEWKSIAKGLKARFDSLEHTDLRIDNDKPVFYRLVVE